MISIRLTRVQSVPLPTAFANSTRALHTAHCAPETAVLECWKGEPWLRVNNVYTYSSVYVSALKQYAQPERLPFLLIESAHENEHRAGE